MINAPTFRDRLKSKSEFDRRIHVDGIGAANEGVVVAFIGHALLSAERLPAEQAADRVPDVRGTFQKIKVRVPIEYRCDDVEMARRVADIMEWSTFLPAGTVQVKVAGRWATLTGAVDWQYQKEFAEEGVRNLVGIVGVWNLITIKHRVLEDDVRAQIAAAYRRKAEFNSAQVEIAVNGSEITLSGRARLER